MIARRLNGKRIHYNEEQKNATLNGPTKEMSTSPHTRPSLLIRVRDSADSIAWNEFVQIYAPLIHAYGLKKGLQDADAADLAQDVLASVSKSINSFDYEPGRGSFRGWLFTVTLNRLRQSANKQQRQVRGTGESDMHAVLHEYPDAQSDEEEWNREHEARLFQWASELVKKEVQPATWDAFWLTAVQHKPPSEVAKSLKMSVGTVYVAKSRVVAKIKERIQSIEAL